MEEKKDICNYCGERKEIFLESFSGKRYCRECVLSSRKKRRKEKKRSCSICGQIRSQMAKRNPPLCNKCYRAPKKHCSNCGKRKVVAKWIKKSGKREKPLCYICYRKLRKNEQYKKIKSIFSKILSPDPT